MFDFTSRFETGNKNLLTYVTSNTSDSSRINKDYITWNRTILLLFLFKQITTIVNSINIYRNIIVYFVIIGLGIHHSKNGLSIVWLDRYGVISERKKYFTKPSSNILFNRRSNEICLRNVNDHLHNIQKFGNQLISSKGKSHKIFNNWQIWLRSM